LGEIEPLPKVGSSAINLLIKWGSTILFLTTNSWTKELAKNKNYLDNYTNMRVQLNGSCLFELYQKK